MSLGSVIGETEADRAARRARSRLERDTIDPDVPRQGREKSARMALGLELLCALIRPGQTLTQRDIAVWCGCTNAAIRLIEQRALRKLAHSLQFGSARGVMDELCGTKPPALVTRMPLPSAKPQPRAAQLKAPKPKRPRLKLLDRAREGEVPLKEWVAAEAVRCGCSLSCIYMRLSRGDYPHLQKRRENARVIFVKAA